MRKLIEQLYKEVWVYLFTLLIVVILSGCGSVKYVPVETKVTETIETVDTLIEIKLVAYKDTVAINDTVSYLFNEYAFSWARWSNGLLQHSLGIFPNKPLLVTVPKTIHSIRVQEPKIIKVEKELNKWDQFKVDYGGYALIIIAGWLVWLIIKKRLKITS